MTNFLTIKPIRTRYPRSNQRNYSHIESVQQQTLLWNDDKYLRIAPGEMNVPQSLLFDQHAEELSFPSIYCSQFRTFREEVRVTPFMMTTSVLRRSDRRGVTPYHLAYMAMKIAKQLYRE